MAGRAFVSRFSPNRTDPAVLEAIFVQRHRLAEVWLERLRDSVLAGVKHHLLAVGPRGCGKSHLVALLVGRLRKDPAVCEHVRIAWLPEDETTPSFWKFLLRILRALNAEYGDAFPPPPREELTHVTDDRRTAVLADYLLKKLGGRTLLVVVENLDDVMRGLKDEGQKRWRAFLQEHPVAVTLATAQQLTEDVSSRDRPFFNFFQIEHLQPLTADEALTLLRKIAEHTGNQDLASFLQTPTGQARVRAIRHLGGGSHRVFIILSEFATRENLDDLVTAFEELLDELTPYYQERLRWLPDQQREIVEFLCRQARTVPVKEIAGELFLSEQTAAAQLKGLRDKGYAMAASVGRESRYELAEPLMRLCVEVKDPRGEPIRLIVEFLRVWYDRAGVEGWLQCLPMDAGLERRYFEAVLQAHSSQSPDPIVSALNRDLDTARASSNSEAIIPVLIELAETAVNTIHGICAVCELQTLGQHRAALAALDRMINIHPKLAGLWLFKGLALLNLKQYEEALAAYDEAIKLDPENFFVWSAKGTLLNHLDMYTGAVAACDRVIELAAGFPIGWCHRGRAKLGLGQTGGAVDDFRHAIELAGNYVGALDSLAEASASQGNWGEAEWVLIERFRLPPSPLYVSQSSHLSDLIATIFRVSTDRRVWMHRVRRLMDIAIEAQEERKQNKIPAQATPNPSPVDTAGSEAPPGPAHLISNAILQAIMTTPYGSATVPLNPLGLLGDSLVRSLTKRAYAEAPADDLDAWAAVWEEVAQRHPDLSLATRLFTVGVRYLRTKDERVLFDLVQEERAILHDLFGLDDGTDAS